MYQIVTQFGSCIPRRRPVRAVAGSGTGTFGLRVTIAPGLHISSAAAIVVSVPWVVLSVAVLLEKRLTCKVRGCSSSRTNV